MSGDVKADDDGVAVVVVENVGDADRLQLHRVWLQRGGTVDEVIDRQVLDALATSSAQLDHRPAAESTASGPRRPGPGRPGVLGVQGRDRCDGDDLPPCET